MAKTSVRSHKRKTKSGKITQVKQHSRDQTDSFKSSLTEHFDAAFLSKFAEHIGSPIESITDDGRYKTVETENGERYIIFDDPALANIEAEDRLIDFFDSDPESISDELREKFSYISDLDKKFIAEDLANSRVDDLSPTEIAAELSNLEQQKTDIDSNDSVSVDKAREKLRDLIYDDILKEIEKDSFDYLVNKEGLYSKEDYMKQNYVQFDSKAAAKYVNSVDGIEMQLAPYDHDWTEVQGKLIYREN